MSFVAPQVIAHRGIPGLFPENTLVSLTRSLANPHASDGVELDVRLSADGELFVFHDPETERLAGVPGSIEDRSAVEIEALRVSGELIPRLAQVLEAVLEAAPPGRPALLNVEVKMPREPALIVRRLRPLLDPLMADSRVELVVSSFDPRVLSQALGQQAPWRLALLYESAAVLECLDALESRGVLDLHPADELVTPEHLAAFAQEQEGRPRRCVRVWTVDDPWRARALASLGVDAIITNQPGRIRRALWSC